MSPSRNFIETDNFVRKPPHDRRNTMDVQIDNRSMTPVNRPGTIFDESRANINILPSSTANGYLNLNSGYTQSNNNFFNSSPKSEFN